MNKKNVVLCDKKVSLTGKIFIGESSKFVINKEKTICLGCEDENKEKESIGFVASGITTVVELNEIIHQLQTLAGQMADGLYNKKN